jgi:hypothetical protein
MRRVMESLSVAFMSLIAIVTASSKSGRFTSRITMYDSLY